MSGGAAAGDPVAEEVAARLVRLRARLEEAAPDPAAVTVVAVSKGFGPGAVRAALGAGLTEVGENYAAELLSKAQAVGSATAPVWHYLGAVQRNKVARLAAVVTWWQSVTRVEEGVAIVRHRADAVLLVQVDIAGLPGRRGVPPEQVAPLVASLRSRGAQVRGLMAVGVPGPAEASRPGFRRVVQLADELELPVRSLGMSEDLEVALAEGSTMVRVGRALFGDRPGPGPTPAATA